jgi:hypothetical protein
LLNSSMFVLVGFNPLAADLRKEIQSSHYQ